MELTKDNVKSLGNVLYQVWSEIGSDMQSVYGDMDESLTYEGVIESCIDAGRVTMFVPGPEGKAADQLIKDLIKEHGYPKVLKFLAKTFPMC